MMNTGVLFFALSLIVLTSPTYARFTLEQENGAHLRQPARISLPRLRNDHEAKTFFGLRKLPPYCVLKRTEAYYHLPLNLERLKSRKNGQTYPAHANNRLLLKNIFWQGPEIQGYKNFLNTRFNQIQSTKDVSYPKEYVSLSSNVSFKTEDNNDARRCELACELYESLKAKRFTRFFKIFSEAEKENSLYGWRFDLLLGTVLHHFIKESRFQNGHGYIYNPFPGFELEEPLKN
jgi:hypothetical protein